MPRLFIAIDPPVQIHRDLESICHGLPADTRWTPADQFHLTLRFIGETSDHLTQQITEGLSNLPFRPFLLQLKGVGFFPVGRQPTILWAGVAENHDLMQLQGLIEARLVQLGLSPENRRFHPHLTLARLTPRTSPEILAGYLALNSHASFPPFLVDGFHLYSSVLTRKGAFHNREETFTANCSNSH